jgi:hypothetical protein
MATDSLWDAAGDLAVGTGANTGAKLTLGTSGKVLQSNGTTVVYAGMVGCHLTNSAAQSLATGFAWNTVTFDTELFDTDTLHSTSSNTGRITIPSGLGGYYHVGASVFYPGVSQNSGAAFFKNGTQINGNNAWVAASASSTNSVNSTLIALAAGDYIEVKAYNGQAGAFNTGGTGDYQMNSFWAFKVGV